MGSRPYCLHRISIHAPRAGRDRCAGKRCFPHCISIHAPRAGRDPPIWWYVKGGKHFNPRAPCGARQGSPQRRRCPRRISIHAPRAGRDDGQLKAAAEKMDFNPRAPCGARLQGFYQLRFILTFQSTRPVRGATEWASKAQLDAVFQSTRPVRGATRTERLPAPSEGISIHAPRAGRDYRKPLPVNGRNISIHAPRAGRDLRLSAARARQAVFQSTRPVRGATVGRKLCVNVRLISIHAPRAGRDRGGSWVSYSSQNFNPRAPCGARLISAVIRLHSLSFQSTRPVRGATDQQCSIQGSKRFQSTRPVRGATHRLRSTRTPWIRISIHAPRAGRDRPSDWLPRRLHNFNPRAPCGARQAFLYNYERPTVFQSTRPVRGATLPILPLQDRVKISIHAPRAGRDIECGIVPMLMTIFQSTRPVRGATLHR